MESRSTAEPRLEPDAWLDDATWFQSIQSTIAALARTSEALLVVLKPYAQRVAEGDVSSVEERVGSDADRALEAAQIAWWGG